MSPDYAGIAGDVVTEFSGDPVSEVTQIHNGGVNQVFAVKTATNSVIVRLNEAEKYFEEYEKERWCIEQARLVGIPGPTVLKIGKVGDTAYMLETLVEGENGTNPTLDKVAIWQTLGHYARLIHSIKAFPASAPGLSPFYFDNFALKWPDFLTYNIESLTEDDPLLALGVYDINQSVEIKRRFEGLRSRKYDFGLIHRDLAPRNTIVEPSGRVVLLDWGCAEINIVPHSELLVVLGWQINDHNPGEQATQAFLCGYGISQADFDRMLPELELLLLLRSIDTVRWAIARKPDRIQPLAEDARKAREILFPDI